MKVVDAMKTFSSPVSTVMTTQVATIGPDMMLSRIARELDERHISAMPVVDDKGAMLGVISRTDLLRVGRIQAGSHRKASVLTLPERRASELLKEKSRVPIVVTPTTSLRDASRKMRDERVHRVFVVDNGTLVGVISTLDVMLAVRDAKIDMPISEIMSTPLFSITAQQPLSAAVERLEHAHVTGLVVLDDDFPVGVFTQLEAMQSRDLPRDTRVDELFDPSMLCLPVTTKVFRAAEQAARMNVRRIIPCRDRDAVGIVTSFDFVKLAARD